MALSSPKSTDFKMLECDAVGGIAGNLSNAITHDLRNTLTSVKLAVQMVAKNERLSDRDARRLQIAHREIRAMERTLSLWSELDRQTPPRKERRALRLVVHEALSEVAQELQERNVVVKLSEAPFEFWANVDAQRLQTPLAAFFLSVGMGLPPGAPLKMGWSAWEGQAQIQVLLPHARIKQPPPNLSLAALSHVVRLHRGVVDVFTSGKGTEFAVTFGAS